MAFIHLHKQSSATLERRQGLDAILKKIIKRQLPFLIGGTITGIIMTYYYGFLFSIIVNSAIWMLISFMVNKYYYRMKSIYYNTLSLKLTLDGNE
jgi:ABC-type transport system involved in Fe-S cluster assembly fused permease/ATPase subunit